jgi:hypothetical protein
MAQVDAEAIWVVESKKDAKALLREGGGGAKPGTFVNEGYVSGISGRSWRKWGGKNSINGALADENAAGIDEIWSVSKLRKKITESD